MIAAAKGATLRRGLWLMALLLAAPGCPTRTQWVATRLDGGSDAGVGVCADATVRCGESCVDTATDPAHCGGCDEACDPLEVCVAGGCVCTPGTVPCGDACRDLGVDPLHCGGCFVACEQGEQCRAETCECRPGLSRCGTACVDTDSDAEHCGDCTTVCEGATPYCYAGTCTATPCESQNPAAEGCGAEERSCLTPADLQTSPLHCGECNDSCEPDQLCLSGDCRSFYPAAGCTSCPCAEVCGTNLCCSQQGTTVPLCLVGAVGCP